MKQRNTAVDLTDLAIGIMVLGIVVSVGAVIMLNLRDNQFSEIDGNTILNEVASINITADTLAESWFNAITICTNRSAGSNAEITSGNWTLTETTSTDSNYAALTNASTTVWGNVSCNYTTYDTTDVRWSLPNDTALGLAEYGNWFEIIVIVGIAGLILSLIFMAFGNRGTQGSDVNY